MDNISKAYNLNICSDIFLELPLDSVGSVDLEVRRAEFKVPDTAKTKIYRAGSLAEYAKKNDVHYLVWPNMVQFKITEKTVFYQSIGIIPDGLLRVLLLSEVLGIVLFLKGYVLLHASSVLIKGYAEVFLGMPGAGKSTTVAAFAKYGFKILADDIVAISFNQLQTPEVTGSFPEIKIWKDSAEGLGFVSSELLPAWEGKNKFIIKTLSYESIEKWPLKKINIIKSSDSIEEFVTNKIDSHLSFIKYFPLPHQLLNSNTLPEYFNKVSCILKCVDVFEINHYHDFQTLDRAICERITPK